MRTKCTSYYGWGVAADRNRTVLGISENGNNFKDLIEINHVEFVRFFEMVHFHGKYESKIVSKGVCAVFSWYHKTEYGVDLLLEKIEKRSSPAMDVFVFSGTDWKATFVWDRNGQETENPRESHVTAMRNNGYVRDLEISDYEEFKRDFSLHMLFSGGEES